MNDKKLLRREMINIRANIHDKEAKSKQIINKIIKLDIYQKSKVVALYKSLDMEVNLDFLIDFSINNGKIVLLPKVIDNDILFIKYNKGDLLEKSKFKVLEPINNNQYNGVIPLVIVPGLAFDNNNNRLGYGKGYYDRFLKNKSIYKIGVCFKEQLINNVITSLDDVKMDLILTDD